MKELEEMSPLEKLITQFIMNELEGYEPPKDFDEVMVDIGGTKYGKNCSVTFTFKKPFKLEDSDFFHNTFREIKRDINTFFGNQFDNISTSSSTKERYTQTKEYFKKNLPQF
jgi:hypothetical protein